ncbi:MAG: ABC transporter ATP-binding protein [Saprospiraceae bacterium]
MEIFAEHLYKRYSNNYWVIKDLNLNLTAGKVYGLSGANGSGKTTLMHLMAGLIIPTKGKIIYQLNGVAIEDHLWFRHFSFAAPYADLYDYLSVNEFLELYLCHKEFTGNLGIDDFLKICFLEPHKEKFIKNFSSGMKQRLKLALALLTRSQIVFLDEPLSNLDDFTKNWYFSLLEEHKSDRIIVIASNDEADFNAVEKKIELTN